MQPRNREHRKRHALYYLRSWYFGATVSNCARTDAPMPTLRSMSIGKMSMPRKQHTSVPPDTKMVWPAPATMNGMASSTDRPWTHRQEVMRGRGAAAARARRTTRRHREKKSLSQQPQ